MELSLTAIARRTDVGGGLGLELTDPATGNKHHATVPAPLVDELIMRFQKSIIEGAKANNNYATLPQLLMTDANLAHQAQETELMVSIDQTGWVVLIASNQVLQHLRSLIDRVLAFRNSPSTKTQ